MTDTLIAIRPRPVSRPAPRRPQRKMSPKMMALAYRIYVYASRVGWDLTLDDLVDLVDAPRGAVRWVLGEKDWFSRLRVTLTDQSMPHLGGYRGYFHGGRDSSIDGDFDAEFAVDRVGVAA